MKFHDWLAEKVGTRDWLVGRLSPRRRALGYDLGISQKRFTELKREYEEAKTMQTFVGVPLAKLRRDIWYWPSYETARAFAEANDLPTDRIISYQAGWAIQYRKSGPYVSAEKE
jgi:hypothetical protein